MKTDFERTKEFLDSLGILYGERREVQYNVISEKQFNEIIIGETRRNPIPCDKVDGYNGFYTQFNFDKDGKFLTVGAWE